MMNLSKALIFSLLISPTTWGAFGFNQISEPEALIPLKQEANAFPKKSAKVLVWNIYKQSEENFEEALFKIIDDLKPDISLFQEGVHSERTDALCLKNSDCYFSVAFSFKEKGYGVLTSSLLPLMWGEAVHSNKVEPILYTPKTSLISVFSADNREIMVINTHGINFVSLHAYKVQLNEIVEKASHFDGPILWAGDFNSWNPGRNSILSRAIKTLKLTSVEFKNSERIKTFMGHRLDHVFTRDLKISHAEVLKTKASDHNPLTLEISWE